MAKRILFTLRKDFLFLLFSIASLCLIVISFVLPPAGIIDNSVFAGVGEIFAFAALNEVRKAIQLGLDAKIQHNNTSVTLSTSESDEDE